MQDIDRAFDAVFGKGSEEPASPAAGQEDLVPLGRAIDDYSHAVAPQGRASEAQRNSIADLLSRRLTLYAVAGGTRVVTPAELQSARFVEGGELLVFRDRRQPVKDLAVERSALTAVIGAATT